MEKQILFTKALERLQLSVPNDCSMDIYNDAASIGS